MPGELEILSEYVCLPQGSKDYKFFDQKHQVALSLTLDNFLFVISLADFRERVVDRIKLVSKTQYDSFEIVEYNFGSEEKLIVLLSSKGNVFRISLRDNFKFDLIRELKFEKFKLNAKPGGKEHCWFLNGRHR